MFSDNQQISGRQLSRLIVMDFFAITGLLVPQMAAKYAKQDGLIAIFYTTIITMLYTAFIFYLSRKMNDDLIGFLEKKAGRLVSVLVGIVFFVKYLATAGYVLSLLGEIVFESLLPEVNMMIIIAVMILVAAYAVMKGIEIRGRISELLFYVVLIPILLILVFAFPRVDKYNLAPVFETNQLNIIKTAGFLTVLFSPAELLLFMTPHFKNTRKSRASVYISIGLVGLVNLLLFAVNVGIFGVQGTIHEKWPTLTLMQVVKLPGSFIERQEGIMAIFFIVSLFAIISALIYYLILITKSIMKTQSTRRYGWLVLVLLFFIAVAFSNKGYIQASSKGSTNKVEIEDRSYVMAFGIDKSSDGLSVTYAFPDISKLTGQEAPEQNKLIFECSVPTLYEAERKYGNQSDKTIDFSQLKVIVLGKGLLEDKAELKKILNYFKKDSSFARNTLICVTDKSAGEIIKLDEKVTGSIGIYLQKMFDNNIKRNYENVGQMINNLYEGGHVGLIPLISIENDSPIYTGSIMINGNDVVSNVSLEDTSYYQMMHGKGEGYMLHLLGDVPFAVESSDYYIKIDAIADKTVHVTLKLTGILALKGSPSQIKGTTQDELNTMIENKIQELLLNLREQQGVDYLETHKLLGIANKTLWKKYKEKQDLFDNLFIEVQSEYSIN